jgi:hypothetical protein
MATQGPRYTKDEFAKRGDAIYDRDVRLKVSPEDHGKFVAIDIESGDYEIDADELAATDRLLDRRPDAQIWLKRIGFRFTHRFAACGRLGAQ